MGMGVISGEGRGLHKDSGAQELVGAEGRVYCRGYPRSAYVLYAHAQVPLIGLYPSFSASSIDAQRGLSNDRRTSLYQTEANFRIEVHFRGSVNGVSMPIYGPVQVHEPRH